MEECSKEDEESRRFVSRTALNNGVSAYARQIENGRSKPAHTISVAIGRCVLSSFYHDKEFYSGRELYYLIPNRKMSKEEMIFYALCIKANKYKYNYGKAANKTLREILLPAEMPKEFHKITFEKVSVPKNKKLIQQEIKLSTEKWQWFEIKELFDGKKGKRLTKADMIEGETLFIGSIESNNGYRDYINEETIYTGNTITINYNGSVAEAFYQPNLFGHPMMSMFFILCST